MEIENWKLESAKMFEKANTPKYVSNGSFYADVYEGVSEKFIASGINKTDFTFLLRLMSDFWNVEESLFEFQSFERFKQKTGLAISSPNLSRSLKALQTSCFVEKVPDIKEKITYKFLVEFAVLKFHP